MNFPASLQARQASVIAGALLRFLLTGLCFAVLFGLIAFDIAVLGNDIPEVSATEFAQEGTLALIVLCLASVARRRPAQRPLAVLIGGFFACMLIRELDMVFDLIHHGFWRYPALLVAAAAILYALRQRALLLHSLASFVSSPAYVLVSTGLAVVLVFSRLLGMDWLWHQVMGEGYLRVVKNVVEEGTELLGYVIILQGAWRYRCAAVSAGQHRSSPADAVSAQANDCSPTIASHRRVN